MSYGLESNPKVYLQMLMILIPGPVKSLNSFLELNV
jgi:hypothetical protein